MHTHKGRRCWHIYVLVMWIDRDPSLEARLSPDPDAVACIGAVCEESGGRRPHGAAQLDGDAVPQDQDRGAKKGSQAHQCGDLANKARGHTDRKSKRVRISSRFGLWTVLVLYLFTHVTWRPPRPLTYCLSRTPGRPALPALWRICPLSLSRLQ